MVENIINKYDLIGGIKRRRQKKSTVLFYISIFLIIIFIGFLIYLIAKPSSNTESNLNSESNLNTESNMKNNKIKEIEKYKNSGCIYDKDWEIKSKNADDNLKYKMSFKNVFVKTKNKNWCLLPGYISGNGIENINWKYTDDPNDKDCMNNWTFYDNNGIVIEKNISNITKLRDNKNWCPLNVYLSDKYTFTDKINLNELELNPIGKNKIYKII